MKYFIYIVTQYSYTLKTISCFSHPSQYYILFLIFIILSILYYYLVYYTKLFLMFQVRSYVLRKKKKILTVLYTFTPHILIILIHTKIYSFYQAFLTLLFNVNTFFELLCSSTTSLSSV